MKDIVPGPGSSLIHGLGDTVVGNILFSPANDGVHGTELWKSDGTSQGTTLVSDISIPPFHNSNLKYLTNVNGQLFFWTSPGLPVAPIAGSPGLYALCPSPGTPPTFALSSTNPEPEVLSVFLTGGAYSESTSTTIMVNPTTSFAHLVDLTVSSVKEAGIDVPATSYTANFNNPQLTSTQYGTGSRFSLSVAESVAASAPTTYDIVLVGTEVGSTLEACYQDPTCHTDTINLTLQIEAVNFNPGEG